MPDGRAFELVIADRMRALGWQCQLTPASGDFGADLICHVGSETAVIQCKCYEEASSIGVGAVQEACTAVSHFKATVGMVIYEGRPSRAARTLASSVGVRMFHAADLATGWEFDRTAIGLQIRKREEAERRAQEAREAQQREAERKHAYEEAHREYVRDLEGWKTEHPAWAKKSKAWNNWRGVNSAAAIIGALVLFTSSSNDDAWIGIGLLVGAIAIYFAMSPGSEPTEPQPPTPLAGGSSPGPRRASTVGMPSGLGPGVAKQRIDSNERTVIRCSRCSKLLRVPPLTRLRIGCPACGLSEIRDTPPVQANV